MFTPFYKGKKKRVGFVTADIIKLCILLCIQQRQAVPKKKLLCLN